MCHLLEVTFVCTRCGLPVGAQYDIRRREEAKGESRNERCPDAKCAESSQRRTVTWLSCQTCADANNAKQSEQEGDV
ncbi:Cutinase transcription factor 1 beta [Fusarium oxysporum f. sp. albedinis]|nr:Cutinase transcription factor 1 beta [Fusarium oxysporum f. sp. albedinis]